MPLKILFWKKNIIICVCLCTLIQSTVFLVSPNHSKPLNQRKPPQSKSSGFRKMFPSASAGDQAECVLFAWPLQGSSALLCSYPTPPWFSWLQDELWFSCGALLGKTVKTVKSLPWLPTWRWETSDKTKLRAAQEQSCRLPPPTHPNTRANGLGIWTGNVW